LLEDLNGVYNLKLKKIQMIRVIKKEQLRNEMVLEMNKMGINL
jgi:hypothetical protein